MQLLFVPLIFSVLHKKQAGNARVTVAAMGRTWFFNQTRLQYSPALIAALRSNSVSGPALSQQSNSGFLLLTVVFVVLHNAGDLGHMKNFVLHNSILYSL